MFATLVFALSFFSAESLVTTLVGFVITAGLTQWLKKASGAYGNLALVLAVVVAFVVAVVAVVASSFLNGSGISWETLPAAALQIFALATMAYKLFLADTE